MLTVTTLYKNCRFLFLTFDGCNVSWENKTRNTVSNAHKMIPPRFPMFCMAKSLFCSGKPQNHADKKFKLRGAVLHHIVYN